MQVLALNGEAGKDQRNDKDGIRHQGLFTTKSAKNSVIASAPICRQTNPKKNMPNGVCRVDIFRLSAPPISGRSWSTRQGQTPTRQPRCLRTAATSRRVSSGISDSEIPFCIDPAFWFKRRVVCPVIQPDKTSGANLMRPVTTTAERRKRGRSAWQGLPRSKTFNSSGPKKETKDQSCTQVLRQVCYRPIC